MEVRIAEHCNTRRFVQWSLRIVIAIQCLGVAGQFVLSEFETESSVYGFLFFECDWPEPLSQLIDDIGAYGCLAAAFVVLGNGFVSNWFSEQDVDSVTSKIFRLADTGVLLFVATWAFALAATQMIRDGVFAELTIGEQAVRFVTPIALLVLTGKWIVTSEKRLRIGAGLLAVATAITFAVHGYKAQQLYGPFTDLILLSNQRIFHFDITQSTAERILTVIGWLDLLLAALLLTIRWRGVVIYMTLWGMITAFSRVSAFGIVAWPETLVRSANSGAPFVLLLLYRYLATSKSGEPKSTQ